MLILVGGEKGGNGKSSFAQNIAVHLTTTEHPKVLIVDCDDHQSSLDWINTRATNTALSHIDGIRLFGKIRNDLLNLKSRHDYVVIDCGGLDNLALGAAMSVSQKVLLPVRPKQRDLKNLSFLDDAISTCQLVNPNMTASIVLSQCTTSAEQTQRINDARQQCQALGLHVLETVSHHHSAYDEAEETGRSVNEIEPNSQAAKELDAIIKEFLKVSPTN
ncbi:MULTISPECIES: division plane positioning ATPase MipZ [unclassified Agarivorans]|uniref:division plane positioning ATPase MipZ n=1 Tax=unclassified Agarivorans TaxID=2636026 RepID=UPI0026E13855|nr:MULTISPECIES: division plane positioning ATPase MipZ [unclassified Agarivorans]MDO6687590.1 division plane positioning ATPase MipZ [Agarivorans sp. 3_MG-2023]MDO6717077.1 division plane positioning ATPase MipZ [Agarivorans sp. 2_MG-2023]